MKEKLPTVIGITGSLIGAALMLAAFFTKGILLFFAGTIVLLTSLCVYILCNIWNKKLAFGAKLPVTAVLTVLYVSLAAYGIFVITSDKPVNAMEPGFINEMDPGMEGDMEMETEVPLEGGGLESEPADESDMEGESAEGESSEGESLEGESMEGETDENGEPVTSESAEGEEASTETSEEAQSENSNTINNSGVSNSVEQNRPVGGMSYETAISVPIK